VALTTFADLVFAAGVVVAAAALTLAMLRRGSMSLLVGLDALEGIAAVGAWIAFALRHDRPLAVAAGGLTGCLIAATAAVLLAGALRRTAEIDSRITEAEAHLRQVVERERETRASELELTLARARADSRSILEEQERRLAEERRAVAEQQERAVTAALATKLAEAQAQVEQRLAGWAEDLDRTAEATKAQITELRRRQEQMLKDIEQRMLADAERLAAESDGQRAALAKIRSDIERTLAEALTLSTNELDVHAAERRRALHELEERLSRGERALAEQIQREENDAAQRIKASFEDVARRQVEQLDRQVERAIASYAGEASQQFAAIVKTAREDAAKRLTRELDRSVGNFAREAETVLAEKLAHVGDAGAKRVERRLADVVTELEKRQLELQADIDTQRAVLETRLKELGRELPSANF
jgi:hypothetical protein